MQKVIGYVYALSVQTKLAVLIFFVVFLISSVSMLINVDVHKNQTNKIIEELIKTNISSNKAFISEFILTHDTWELFKFLKTLSASNIIESCGFIDNENIVIAHTDTEHYRIGDVFLDLKNSNIVPLVQDNVELGYFSIKVKNQTIVSSIKNTFYIQLFILLMVALISLIIANIFMSKLLKRLHILSNNAQAMIEKRWHDVTTYTGKENDEITKIIEKTTKLMQELKSSIEKEEKNSGISGSLVILGEISSSFAHEIKNLLQPLKLLLPQNRIPDKEDMSIINNTLTRIDHQVIDFLALSKPIDFHSEGTRHIKDCVNESIHILTSRLKQKNLKIKSAIDEGFLIKLNTDAIERILINLLNNAIDAAFRDTTIEVSWGKSHLGYSLLRVTNYGDTMSAKTKESLFKPFFTTKKDGSGLGLFSIYKIIYLSRGYIEFQSENNQTNFCLYIPIKENL